MNCTIKAPARTCLTDKPVATFKLRKLVTIGVLAISMLGTGPALAKDPCKTALCMFGLLTGTNDSECNEAIADHFDIVVFKKKKKIDWNKTAKERLGFTNSCPGADPVTNKLINNRFGKSSG